jgi:hypothetical protein
MANAPLPGRDGGFIEVIWGDREQDYFRGRGWTGQITLKPLQKIDLSRTSAIARRAA